MLNFHHLYRHLGLTAALAAAALFPAVGGAQVGLGLAPMREEFKLAPGGQRSGTLALTNDSAAKVRVVANLLDFYIDAGGTPQFGRQVAREAEYSCRQWLVVNPMEMELDGRAQALVRYTVRAPQTAAERSYHCGVGFVTQPAAGEMSGTGLRTAVQIVAAFYAVVGAPRLEGTIKDLRLEYAPRGSEAAWRAVTVLSNPGWMHFRPAGSLEVLDESGRVVETEPFQTLPVLPRRDQNFVFPLKLAAGPGKYTLRARVDLGGEEIQEATALVVATKPNP